MVWGVIIGVVAGLTCWVIGIKSVIGWNRVQLTDVSRKDEEWFKSEYDVIAMNKFLGKTIWIPLAVFCSAFTVSLLFEWSLVTLPYWVGFVVVSLILGGLITYGFIQARGNRFKREQRGDSA